MSNVEILARARLHRRLAEALFDLAKAYGPFTDAMLDKLEKKAEEGYTGWRDDEYYQEVWRGQLNAHIRRIGTRDRFDAERENLLDIANICMLGHWWIGKVGQPPACIEDLRPALRGEEPAGE